MDRAVLAREGYRGVCVVAAGLVSGGESASPEGEVNGGCQRGRRRGGWSGGEKAGGGRDGCCYRGVGE
jgi:hypothetical protein